MDPPYIFENFGAWIMGVGLTSLLTIPAIDVYLEARGNDPTNSDQADRKTDKG